MSYRRNPFLERMSERTTSDQEFVNLFSPKVLERLEEDCLNGAVHIFRSAPGGGKTTILRAFTPSVLRAFWHAKPTQGETYRMLIERGVLDEHEGPQLLGVFLSCAAGYADLPAGSSHANEGLLRALLNCRIVLRALRSVAEFVTGAPNIPEEIELKCEIGTADLLHIPLNATACELSAWAEKQERCILAHLDEVVSKSSDAVPLHARLEGVLWLQCVRFIFKGKEIAPKRLLMIDDVQKLRKAQRSLLLDELVVLRPSIPIWLAGRTIAFSNEFISQGGRNGRDVRDYPLEELWGGRTNQQFVTFAQNILDRRFGLQSVVPGGSFVQYLAEVITADEISAVYSRALGRLRDEVTKARNSGRFREWIAVPESEPSVVTAEALYDVYATRILVAREIAKRQLSLELGALTTDELEERDSSAVHGAAEIFANHEEGVPYYFGLERLCAMATYNVEELLALAAALYDGMKAKQVLRRQAQPQLSPREQEKRLKEAVTTKRDFIPRSHTEGTRARKFLDSVGVFCRERTFLMNAPYAPGVTGVRLPNSELQRIRDLSNSNDASLSRLERVLSECVAENLFTMRDSKPSTSREGGTVFYLNRALCAYYGLPLQYGGWQECSIQRFIEWMEVGLQPKRALTLEVQP
jgi:hypothetical protein